jgi:hypothetical protein
MDETAKRTQTTRDGRARRSRVYYWIVGIATLVFGVGASVGPIMSRVEQPEYKVDVSDGAFEVRSYGPMIAAEAVVEGERQTAINEGFRLVAAYIFGANKPNAKIAMTAPVQQQKQGIVITAPVTQQSAGNRWTVRFIMPKSWTMETLPTPNDSRVALKPIPARRYITITFSGIATTEAIQQRTEQLRRYTADHKLRTVGEPLLAFYNPPWTLPFLRRNEVMLELRDQR